MWIFNFTCICVWSQRGGYWLKWGCGVKVWLIFTFTQGQTKGKHFDNTLSLSSFTSFQPMSCFDSYPAFFLPLHSQHSLHHKFHHSIWCLYFPVSLQKQLSEISLFSLVFISELLFCPRAYARQLSQDTQSTQKPQHNQKVPRAQK